MKSGQTPAFVLARVFALTAPAWLPVSDGGSVQPGRWRLHRDRFARPVETRRRSGASGYRKNGSNSQVGRR